MKAVVTVIGKDKVGIIQGVTSVLSDNNINVMDINQTLLQGYFTMIMFVDIEKSKKDFKSIKDALEQKAKELEVSIKIQHEDIFKSMHEV
jgi:ACT domain-containing protein